MNISFIFVIKAALYLTAFYLVYAIFLSRDTSYGRNRIYILGSIILSLVLPLITLHTSRPLEIQYFGKMLNDVFVSATNEEAYSFASWLKQAGTVQVIYAVYIAGVVLFLLKLTADLLNLLILIINHSKDRTRIIRFHSFNTSGFSAMGYIFLSSRLSDEESEEIIRHERNHLRRNHFLDIVLIETIKAFQWFNPAIYLIDRSLRAVHEYQADQECLKSGIPVVNYQNLLLNQVFRSKVFNLTNSFSNPSMIRKRMLMMTKKRTPSFAGIKLLAALPLAGLVFLAISAYRGNPSSPPPSAAPVTEMHESEPFVVVEEMPAFKGGDAALLSYLAVNTNYPVKARDRNIQGKVILRFCINENGSVSRVSVLSGVDPDLDAEAVRVVESLPAFIPGRQGGKAVAVWYMVPITFTLR